MRKKWEGARRGVVLLTRKRGKRDESARQGGGVVGGRIVKVDILANVGTSG